MFALDVESAMKRVVEGWRSGHRCHQSACCVGGSGAQRGKMRKVHVCSVHMYSRLDVFDSCGVVYDVPLYMYAEVEVALIAHKSQTCNNGSTTDYSNAKFWERNRDTLPSKPKGISFMIIE